MTVNFRGYLFNDAGTAVQGATVQLLETGTTTQEAATTTDSDGLWYFTESDQDRYDVKITSGSSVRHIRWDDQISLKELDVRNNTGATTPAATFSNLTNSTANQVAVFSGANSTKADNDEIYLSFKMHDSAGNLDEFARMTVVATDVSTTTEDGQIEFDVIKAGTLTKVWTITSSSGAAMSFDMNVDSLTIGSGADTDITLTFDANSADGVITWMEDEDYFQFSDDILMSTTERINLRDTAIYIYSSTDGQLDLVADTEIQIAATTVDLNGNLDVSGTYTGGGLMTTGGNIVIPNAGNIGSASDTDAIAISSGGVVTMNQIPVFSAGINVSGGTIAGTLATAAQGSVTSLGTLTALTVDDVAINGKVITMTGDTSDTTVITAGSAGTLSIVTTDAAGADADIQITADGTVDIDSAGVLTLDSGAAINIEPASGSAILLDGTISIDAGVVTGATSITSTAFVGDITGDVTGTADVATVATTVTITDNESTNENNAIIFTAGGDLDGGNLGLESDGDLYYNPSTGTLTVANVSVSGTFTTVNSVTMNANNAVIFEGTSADAHETTLTSIDATGDRTISLPNVSGTLPVLAAASATQITATPDEINLIDGGTARGTTAVASGDGILINDGGTMRMTNVDTVSTYFASHTVGGGNIVSTGALNSGSITSGFGTIDTGSSTITTTGLISGGSLDIDNVLINGTTIGHTDDTDLLTLANGALTALGTITVGVDDAGHDVKLFGNAAGAYMEWDASEDQLRIMGASADATTSTGKLLLATSLTDINANDVIGKIEFQAPHEAGGTDAITVAASIQAIAQGTFSASVNATDLIFYTGHSEAATEKFRFTSQGEIGIGGANYGSDGQVLTSGGAGAAPAWEDAGGGGGTIDLVADGTIPAGAPTFITSAGKAKHMVRMMADNEVPWPSGAQGNANNVAIAYGTTDNRGIILYHTTSGGDELGQVKGWTVADDGNGTITHGTATQFCSQDSSEYKCWYDDSVNKFFIAYRDRDDSNKGKVMTATVGSDLAITLGGLAEGADNPTSGTIADVTFEGGAFGKNENGLNVAVAYSTTDDAGVIVYADGDDSNKGKAVVVTCPSGTAPTVSSEFEWNGNGVEACDVVWDPDTNKFIIAYEDGNGLGYYIGRIDSGAVVQAGPAIGSGLIDETGVMTRIAIGYDTTADKVIISYRDTGSPYEVYTIAGAVSSAADSGMSITFGTKVQSGVVAASVSNGAVHVIHDPSTDRNIVFASDNHSTGYIEMHIFTISGTALTLVDTIDVYNESGTNTNKMLRQGDALLDPDTGLVHLIHRHDGGSNYPYHIIMSPLADDGGGMGSVTGVGEYIGLNTTAVTDGNTATITTPGGLNENQTGLTVASQYFIGRTGKVSTVSGEHMVGLATASTKMLVLNFDPRGSV